MKIRFLFLLALLWATVAIAGLAPQIVITIRTNGVVDAPWGPVSTLGTATDGFQEAVNALPKSTSIARMGGGTIKVQGGSTYVLNTNVQWDTTWPFYLKIVIESDNTVIQWAGKTNIAGVFTPASTGGRLYHFEFSGGVCSWLTNSQTNVFFQLDHPQFVKIHDTTFVPYYVLTNAQSHGFPLEIDGISFTNIPGMVPIGVGINAGGGWVDIYNNYIFGGAIAYYHGAIRGSFHNNQVFACGSYSPDGINDSTHFKYHTNSWNGNYGNEVENRDTAAILISSGAAIVGTGGGGPLICYGNRYSVLGPVYYAGGIHSYANTYESCQLRALVDADSTGEGLTTEYSFNESGIGGSSGYNQNGYPPDSLLTNSATKIQPNFTIPNGTNDVTSIVQLTANRPGSEGTSNRLILTGVLFANGLGVSNLTAQAGGIAWATNSTLPAGSTTVIRAWLSVTNDSGKVGKIPVYY